MIPISFNPLGGSWTLVAVLLAVITGAVLAFPPRFRGTSVFRKRAETAVRLLAIPIFAVLFTRPSWVAVVVEELPATVEILCDLSESMSVEDGDSSGKSRYDAMRDAFADAQDSLKALSERCDVHVVGFGETIEELPVADGVVTFPAAPTGRETRLGDALAEALKATAGKRLLSVALLSDGAQRTWDEDAESPQEVALRYRDAERPITVAPFGSKDGSASVRDVAIDDLRANDRVFLGNELVVSGRLRALGFANKELPVQLELETEPGKTTVVGTATVVPKSDDATIPWQFTCKPATEGEWKLRVSTPIQPRELLETNNELSAFVKAIDGGVKALYIEGARRYEQNFLRAALDSSSDVSVRYWRPPVSSLVSKFPGKTEAELVSTLTGARKSLVEPFFAPDKYATYILGDVDASAFQKDELAALVERVEEGAGLVILAGERSLGLGGYADTPLAAAVPIEIKGVGRVPLDVDLTEFESSESRANRARLLGDYHAEPATDALESRDAFAISLSVDQKKNVELWRSLPPLSDVYRLGRVKRNATTLLVARAASGGADAPSYPLLTTQRYGLGRVAVVATDSTWRWRMRGKETEHAKFWRQLILWSARTDELLEGELAIETDSSRLVPGESAVFSVVYRPKEGENVEQVRAEASIVAPDGSRTPVALTREQGVWRGVGPGTDALGDYQIEASLISESGETLQTARSRFLVDEKNLERERPGAALDDLERLAVATQGRTIAPGEFKDYLDELRRESRSIVDTREEKFSFYDSRFVFLAFVALMIADWLLRRRWGMV